MLLHRFSILFMYPALLASQLILGLVKQNDSLVSYVDVGPDLIDVCVGDAAVCEVFLQLVPVWCHIFLFLFRNLRLHSKLPPWGHLQTRIRLKQHERVKIRPKGWSVNENQAECRTTSHFTCKSTTGCCLITPRSLSITSDFNICLFLCIVVFRLGREPLLSRVDCSGLTNGWRWVLNSGLFLEVCSLFLSLERAEPPKKHIYMFLNPYKTWHEHYSKLTVNPN